MIKTIDPRIKEAIFEALIYFCQGNNDKITIISEVFNGSKNLLKMLEYCPVYQSSRV